MKSTRVATIDGLRGVCAFYILGFHLIQDVMFGGRPFHDWVSTANVAVPVFFILSGFLVSCSAESKIKAGDFWRRDFYIKRAFRILPLWWLIVFAESFAERTTPSALITNITLTFGFFTFNSSFILFSSAWSLFVEEIYYVFFPVAYARLRQVSALVIAVALAYLAAHAFLQWAPRFGIPSANSFIDHFPISFVHYFFLGSLLCLLHRNFDLGTHLRAFKMTSWLSWIDVLALASFFMPMFKAWVPDETGCAFAVLAAFVPGGLLARLYKARFLQWSGRHCYFIYIASFYLIEVAKPIREWFMNTIPFGTTATPIAWAVLFYLALCCIGDLSMRIWEGPWMRLGERLIERLNTKSTARDEIRASNELQAS